MQEFLQAFQTDIEISDLQNVVTPEIAMTDKTRNFYYVPGDTKQVNERVRDDDIIATSTFFLDIDIKENLKLDAWIPDQTEEALLEHAEWIKSFLDQSNFKKWRYIIFSGNWIQLHFIWQVIKTDGKKKQWKFWVRSYQEEWDYETRKFFWNSTFRCDKACCNLARLRRLPGTINQKNGREARILYSKNAIFPTEEILPRWEIYYKKVIDQEREIAMKEKQEIRNSLDFWENNIFERINLISIELIVNEIMPEAIFDGRKNWKKAKGGLYGFYKTQGNRLANGGSDHFQPFIRYWGERYSYSVFDLVHIHILWNSEFDTDSIRKTLYFFKNNYGQQR